MRLKNGNLLLRTMEMDDIMLVREWRNAEHVRNHLLDRELISEEQQRNWFRTRQPEREIYFMMEVDGCPAGLIYVTNIQPDRSSFEGNIFIGDQAFAQSAIAIRSTLMVSDLFFRVLHFHSAVSSVLPENSEAQQLDLSLGYRLSRRTEKFDLYISEKADYLKDSGRWRKLFFRTTPDMLITFEERDRDYPFLSGLSQSNDPIVLDVSHSAVDQATG